MEKRTFRSKKSRPRNARQNDRPNQGIFGKVYSTVRDILQPTSWIFRGVSNWIGNSDETQSENSADIVEDSIREDNDVSHTVGQGNKRLRLRFEDNIPSIQSSGTQTWPEQPSQNLFESVPHVQSTTQSSLLDNKEGIPVLNGDDHSENSEGSASTSGCSSLVSSHKDTSRVAENQYLSLRSELKNSRKRKEPSSPKTGFDDLNSSRNLWSTGFSPSSKFQRRLPTISHTNQPTFNLSSFVGPSKLNESVEKKVSSPFYEGKTTFGGASALRRMPPSVAPYQVDRNLRNQIKVRECHSEDSLEGMSSAAKRILLTLEKMSTPVADAKKMPNSETSPVDLSLYLRPPKSRRNTQFTPALASKGPPIANINTIAKLSTLKNHGVSRLRTSLSGSPVASVGQDSYNFGKLPSNNVPEAVDQKSGGGKIKNKLNQLHHSSKPTNMEEAFEAPDLPNIPLPITALPTFNFKKPVDNSQAKGFTFSKPIEHDLTINSSVTSSFTLPPPLRTKTEKNSDLQPNTSDYKLFVFSSPIEHELPRSTVSTHENFTIPVVSNARPAVTSALTWECSTCWVQNPNNRTSCIACETSCVPKDKSSLFIFKSSDKEGKTIPSATLLTSDPPASTFKSSTSPLTNLETSKISQSDTQSTYTFTPSSSVSATWECASCLVRNLERESRCLACETSRPLKDSLKSSGPVSSTWECSSCWVKNPERESKCLACETLRPIKDSQKTSVKNSSINQSSSTTWECSECWVKNPAKESKCIACESLRSSKENNKGGTSSLFSQMTKEWECSSCWVKNPSKESKCLACEAVRFSKGNTEVKNTVSSVFTTWECTSCLVRNPIKEKKCMACETLHPDADRTSNLKDTNGFKFSTPIQNSPITFKFGNYVCTAASTVTTSSFTFGSSTSQSQTTTSSTTGFKFGVPSTTSASFLSSTATTNITQINKDTVNISSSQVNEDTVNEIPVFCKDSEKESSAVSGKNPVNEGNPAIKVVEKNKSETVGDNITKSVTTKSSEQSKATSEKSKILNSVITNISSETSVSKAKEGATPSVTACFSFTTQPLLDSKKSETFPFGGLTPKEKLSSSSLPSPFGVFTSPVISKDKSTGDEKSLQLESKSVTVSSEGKMTSAFQFTSQPQQVSSAFHTVLSSAPVFKFGEKTDYSKTNLTTISIAPTSTTNAGFSFSNNKSNPSSVSESKDSKLSSAASENVTPCVKTEVAETTSTTTNTFLFGSTTTTSAPTAFSFFPPSTTTTTAVSSLFTFSATSNNAQTSKPGGFTFKGLEKPQNIAPESSATSVSSTSQPTTSILNTNSTAPMPSGGFVFGAPKTEAQSSAAGPFTFGSGSVSSSNTSAFSAFQPSQPNNTFQFGIQATATTVSTVGTTSNFSFTKSDMSSQVPTSVSQNPVSSFGAPTNNFVFGSKNEPNQIANTVTQSSGIQFGSSTPSFSFANKTENTSAVPQNSNPTFGSTMPGVFGNASVPTFGSADKPASGGFNFGPVSSSVFQFGASNNSERKRPANASAFSFGTPTASESNSSFQQNFNVVTPPSFNFGAASTPAGSAPFQFAAASAPKTPSAQSAPRKYRKALRRVRKD